MQLPQVSLYSVKELNNKYMKTLLINTDGLCISNYSGIVLELYNAINTEWTWQEFCGQSSSMTEQAR